MNSFVTGIAQLFSSVPSEMVGKSEENLNNLTVYYQISQFDKQMPANLGLSGLNERDVLTIGLFDGIDDDASEERLFRTDKMDEWDDFSQYFNSMEKDDPVKIKISIAKSCRNGVVSIYCPDLFAAYLKSHSLKSILSLFEGICLNNTMCFEYQENDISLIGSSLAFVKKGHYPVYLTKPLLNKDVVTQGKYLCCNDLIQAHLLPVDFSLSGTDCEKYPILPLFHKLTMLYTLCYLFDYLTLTGDELFYKLNGYKTLAGCIKVSNIESASVDDGSWNKYLDIFKWLYNGGNLTDKAAIARNIISLNIEDEDGLSLRDGTFDAIDSNYRIYEKENVKQYIELRNNVAAQLRDYQRYIIGIYDEFEEAFKKLLFSFLAFAFTTSIIRVLAKNIKDNILIPDTIITLLLGLCAVSLLYYTYARWERRKKVELFDKQYNDTRKFYEELLSPEEMSELFTDERNKDGTYKAFIEERTCRYDFLWVGVNVVFIAALLYIRFFINNAS